MNHWVGENSLLNSPWVEKQKQNLTGNGWSVGATHLHLDCSRVVLGESLVVST